MAKKDWMIKESALDDDQIRVLTAINDKSCVIDGCAGSGKSVLALIKAQRLQKEKGDNYQIVVFTKALCNYMNAGREALGLHKRFNYHWYWKNRLNCPSSDYVIVDEIQDFDRDEIQEFITATNKTFFFFGDTAQSIYQGLKETMPVEGLTSLFSYNNQPKRFSLYRNYRLPLPVAHFAQYVGIDLDPFDEKIYKSEENTIPKLIKYGSLEEQIEAIAKIIQSGDLTDVGIFLSHNTIVKQVSDLLNDKGINHEAKYTTSEGNRDDLDFDTTNPKVMTYHSAKGLQFETVFLPNISALSSDKDKYISERKALYVAITRTYRNLYIMYSGTLPEPLSNVPKNLYSTELIDTVEDI